MSATAAMRTSSAVDSSINAQLFLNRLCSAIFPSSSLRGTAMSRRSKLLNRPYSSDTFSGGFPFVFFFPMATPLRQTRLKRLARQFLVGDALPRDRAEHFLEPATVFVLSLVEPKRFFVEVAGQVVRPDA